MKATGVLQALLFFLCMILLAGCSGMETADHESKHEYSFAKIDRHDVLYTCNCGSQCECKTVSTEPGKCACGLNLKWGHVLKIEGSEAILCQCGEGCQCYGFNSKDLSKCTCGVKTRRISLKGTGIYFCNSGGSGYCNYVSSSPGKCRCGNKLIRAG